jgi:hypothetical protein
MPRTSNQSITNRRSTVNEPPLTRNAFLGPRRYDPATGDIRLVCDRFPTREENRRWCLEALHRLLAEANRVAPSQRFLFAADSKRRGGGVSSPFL